MDETCRVCGAKAFGHLGKIRLPLCLRHLTKVTQLTTRYGTNALMREAYGKHEEAVGLPYEATQEEWDAVLEIMGLGENAAERAAQ